MDASNAIQDSISMAIAVKNAVTNAKPALTSNHVRHASMDIIQIQMKNHSVSNA